ncbi:hypothetical protein L861_10100 [Litchfieldella anticariensis FP35 = DSM 16096]|uniref:Outer membrane protein beta-barrel domain-containing protein n=1 Tax=Litchfieldella anticariensis (strain DSM 16096 / CECT 5854 / CIP 108499 / LMG 22089 / FP35) TaxID=1121939 RepID=S2KKK1_LITA3|nr:porin family protein [Halomonas anticariensis]EPC02687.1 hypothetical protein L861_10100 [Halomonas anticariensis FP35 = DSM 16096]
MKILAISTAVLLMSGTAAMVQAQSFSSTNYPHFYVGGDAMWWEFDPDRGSAVDSIGLRLLGGAQFNDYFAVEGHLGGGGSDAEQDIETKLEYVVGAYAKGILPVADRFRLYGLAGFSEVRTDVSGPLSGDDREGGFSYGAGAEFDMAPNVAVGADYMRYLDKSSHTFDAASVGVRYRF